MPKLIILRILGLLIFAQLFGCVTPSLAAPSQGRIESAAEIEAIASFLMEGETTKEEILEKLGLPGVQNKREDGSEFLAYYWDTSPWMMPEKLNSEEDNNYDPFARDSEEEDFFDPFARDSKEGDSFDPFARDSEEEDSFDPFARDSEEEDYFDPFAGGSEESRTFSMGWLIIDLNPSSVVNSYNVGGPH